MFSKVLKKLSFLRGTRPVWRRPPRATVAILDEVGADELVGFFSDHSVHVIDLSGRTTNVLALVRALVKGRVNQFGYVSEYLRMIRPTLAITMIDTTPFFYRLKNALPNLTTIAIQNGWRGYEVVRDLRHDRGPLAVDHLFCFGEVTRNLYAEHITGNFHAIGSLRSNKVAIQSQPNSKTVALISTLRGKVDLNEFVHDYAGRPKVSYLEVFQRRLQLAEFVAEFCKENSLKLIVLGKEHDDERERDLYSGTLSKLDIDWEYRPRTDLLSNYYHLNESRIAVSTSSSLGYEALGRGIRTAFFMLDSEVTGNFGDKFGWPGSFADDGAIWTNYLDRSKTLEILQRLHDMTDEDWRRLRRGYAPSLMSFDPENLTLRDVIQDILSDKSCDR